VTLRKSRPIVPLHKMQADGNTQIHSSASRTGNSGQGEKG